MRRFILLATAMAWAVGMLTVMGKTVTVIPVLPELSEKPEVVVLPCDVTGTKMVAHMIAFYEGPFREDGSDEEVSGIAALVVENADDTMISEGAVILDWGEDRLVFELFALPAGEKVLVLEKDQKVYSGQPLVGCYGWERREYPENMGQVLVTEAGGSSMLVTNLTNAPVAVTRIRYKSYYAQSSMYIGGICYEVIVEDLAPGEQRIVSPYHYLCGSSRVVSIMLETEK